MRTKEFLSARGVDYRSIDITTDPAGFAELETLGVRTVPVVAVGDEWVASVNLDAVAQLLNLDHDGTPQLDASELVTRLQVVLETAMRLAVQIPAARLGESLPGRDRSFLSLCNHVVEIPFGFVAVSRGESFGGLRAAATPEVDIGVADLVDRAVAVLGLVDDWWSTTADRTCVRVVDTFAGDQTLHQILERTVWHVAQHTRQLAMVVELCGVEPDRPLGARELAGLPVPDEVWD